MVNYGDRIKEAFLELKSDGYNQTKIAEILGLTQASISRYVKGDLQMSESTAILIESKFGYRKEWILHGELPKKIDEKAVLGEVTRISKQGRELDKVPEIRDLIPKIVKMDKKDYLNLLEVIKKFVG